MKNTNNKFAKFSVSLGLLDYINPILYSITVITIINSISKVMSMPWNIFYIIGAVISIIFGLGIPTIKVLIGMNKIKFKLPVMFVFLVNTGIFISGIALLKSILNLNIFIVLSILLLSILFLGLVYKQTKKFNNVAVLIGFIGYLSIYISLFILAIKNGILLSIILLAIAICLFLLLIMIGLKANLKDAKVHWIIESSNIICQLCVAIGTIAIMKAL